MSVFMKGEQDESSIYRSVSLTPVLGKIKQHLTGDLSTEVNEINYVMTMNTN